MRRSLTTLAVFLSVALHAWCDVTVILMRHTEVPLGGGDFALTAQARTRAQALADMLRDTRLDAIFESGFQRTHQTAQPTADRAHIQWQTKTKAIDLAAAICERKSGAVLVVGHSDMVPPAISMLGAPSFQINEAEFDNPFILTIGERQASVVRLRYGGQRLAPASNASKRTSIMQISFVKSGGFAGAMTRVQGTVDLEDGHAEVNGDAAYHRSLTPNEAEALRAGAEPSVLAQAASQIAATQAKRKGMGDLEQYDISVKTSDGKTHSVKLNTSGSSTELEGVSPAAAKFLQWLRRESQNILKQKMTGK
jgi:phosphohistidine phosphatase SixA